MSKQKQFIEEEIRSKKYGINKDGIQEPNPLAKDLQKSVQLLSTELYAKDIHFIFELIQNAEDNQYHHLERPDLEFRLLNYDPTNTENSDGCLCVFNNEIGFTEENIIAICAVGSSTKNKKEGYIGEKGIGFKSVFIVSNSPHIYSNNFHIKFLENDPNLNLSYIVPYWLDDTPKVIQSHHRNTSILLPLKMGKRQKIIDELQNFPPETILFLTKIQSITICFDENIKDNLELIKDSDNYPIIQLLAGEKLCNYWLKKEFFSVPDHVSEGKRLGITERDVVVAFSLDNKKENENGRIFAFLPTEIVSGLPFLVNADFILSSNRETIQINLPWNLWLRDCVANVVVSGFLELIQNSEHRTHAYSFIPLINELTGDLDFLSPICEKIISRLTDQKVVLTENSELALPKDTRLPSSKIRVLFQDIADRPQALRNLNFVAKEISKYAEQLKAIGVAVCSLQDIYNALSDRDWLQNRTIDWLIELYLYLSQIKNLDTNALRKLPILPTQDRKQGRKNIASSESVIFFYSKEGDEALARQIAADPEFSGTYLLSEEFFNRIVDNEVLILWLEKELCIRSFSLSTYLVESLIPDLKNRVLKLRSEDVLSLTKLILENWKNITPECKRQLKTTMLILLDSGRIIVTDRDYRRELVVPVGYELENGWHLLLQEKCDRDHLDILSESYLQFKERYTKELQEFLTLLSVKKIPSLKTWIFVKGDPSSKPLIYGNYVQDYLDNFHPDATRPYENHLDTWMTPSFFHDPEKRDYLENRKALLHWLEEMIKTNNTNQIEQGRVFWFRWTEYSKEVPSGLLHYLTTTPWINSSQGLKKPGEVFRKSAQTFALFSNNLNYLEDDISIDLCKLLGINIEVTPKTVLEYLTKVSSNQDTTLEQVEKLYNYLNLCGFSNSSATDIVNKFEEIPLIYLPNPHNKWYKSGDVMWENASAIFGDLYGWLESAYPNLKEFFTNDNKLRIRYSPDVNHFATAWLRLQEKNNLERRDVEILLDKIYVKLIQFLLNGNLNENWWLEFKRSAKIWTTKSGADSPRFKAINSVFVADDQDLRNLFSNDLSFAWKPERFTYNEITPFFEELSVKLLSHSLQIELVKPNEAEICTDNNLLNEYSKKLLCYLLYNQNKEIYQQRFDEGMLPNLLKSQEFLVSNLTVKYHISGFSKEKSPNSYWDKEECLYLKANIDQADLLEDVAGLLARVIWGRNFKHHHEDSVKNILEIKDEKRFKRILDKKNWHIPLEEKKRIEDIILQDIQPHANPEPPLDIETDTGPTNDDSDQTQRDSGNEDNQTQQDSGNKDDQTQQDSGNKDDQTQQDSGNKDDQTQRDPESATRQRTNESDQTQRDPENEREQARRDPKSATNGKSRNQRIRTYIYVEPNSKKYDEQEKKMPHELKVECEARKHVCAYEKEEGRVPREMDQKNPGYDIISHNPKDNNKRYIEVKGISGEWNTTGVGLSNRQFRENIQYKQNYWLYIVEYALDPNNYRIYRIQNPVFTVDYFMFDSYWKILDLHPNETADPTDNFICGAKIHCGPVLGIGLITDVNTRGDSKILKVKFTDNELWLPLNVRYMYLVEEADG